jgi:general secretion pathway protein G
MKPFNSRGISLIELIVTLIILSFLAMLVLPSAQMAARRTKEIELRRNLRQIRTALDDYYKHYKQAENEGKLSKVLDKSGYPETLQVLVDGEDFGGLVNYKKKSLRRIPPDPFHPPRPGEEPEWGLRSYGDEPDSTSWGGEDVYDVYSLSNETAIDGTKYRDW